MLSHKGIQVPVHRIRVTTIKDGSETSASAPLQQHMFDYFLLENVRFPNHLLETGMFGLSKFGQFKNETCVLRISIVSSFCFYYVFLMLFNLFFFCFFFLFSYAFLLFFLCGSSVFIQFLLCFSSVYLQIF